MLRKFYNNRFMYDLLLWKFRKTYRNTSQCNLNQNRLILRRRNKSQFNLNLDRPLMFPLKRSCLLRRRNTSQFYLNLNRPVLFSLKGPSRTADYMISHISYIRYRSNEVVAYDYTSSLHVTFLISRLSIAEWTRRSHYGINTVKVVILFRQIMRLQVILGYIHTILFNSKL